ncbi:uncharacterized protein Dana_GF17375 [Drosophila ananassae]|uniref:Uncharacterized protein n=1 Tax=Drosophila ananassae TaxID=7217 RepID=B3LX96_DROAN|nr:uncharacterized protein LOC6500159 [Drosophila ananassae]EDV41696.1 uncharacterized protein Dana_GF17375 [Drosophila ananassae]
MRRVRVLPQALLLHILILLWGTHLTGAAAAASAVDKDVAPVGDVKTDLLSLEQEIGGSVVRHGTERAQIPGRRRRGIFFSGSITGFPWYSWSFSGYPYNNYYNYGTPPGYYGYGSGFYPGYLGYQKIIIG